VVTWNSTGGTADFNTATNWPGSVLPGISSVATFDAMQGAIVDGHGITSVEKKFAGTWNLSGANSYTGPT